MRRRPMKFSTLLVCLLLSLLVRPFVLSDVVTRWVYLGVMTVFFVAAIRSLSEDKWQRWTAMGLGIFCIVLRWTTLLHNPQERIALDVVGCVLEIAFLTFVIVMLLVAIFRRRTVTQDNIMGAFAAYLLIALVWGLIFSLVEQAIPGSYHYGDHLSSQWEHVEHREGLLTYFSCCTLMTIGYGDITPVLPLARTLAMLEGMTGQLYVAVLVAVLVGVRVAQATFPRDDAGKPNGN